MSRSHAAQGTLVFRFVALAAVLAAVFAPDSARADRPGYPKVLNYYLTNTVNAEMLQRLSQWDVVVLDADFPYENPTGIATLRSLNPDIKVFAFLPINGTYSNGDVRPPATVAYQYWAGCQASNFWLYATNGTHVSDWPGKWTANLTQFSPTNGQGERFGSWLARFVDDVVFAPGAPWDGLLLDVVTDDITWLNAVNGVPLDPNADGIAEAPANLNNWWRTEMQSCINQIRTRLGANVPIMSNGNTSIYSQLNGNMIENFPPGNRTIDQGNPFGYDWTAWMFNEIGAYMPGLTNFDGTPQMLMTIDAAWDSGTRDTPHPTGRFQAHKRLTLGSALLGDGYYSFHYATWDHASLWWELEYDYNLGEPLGAAYTIVNAGKTLWRRDYENMSVIVNPNNTRSPAYLDMPAIGDLQTNAGWDAYIGPRLAVSGLPDGGLRPTPADVVLHAASPNPFRAGTKITYELSEPARVRVSVFDLQGKRLASLVDRQDGAGSHEVAWSGLDADRRPLAPGVYFVRLEAGNRVLATKILKE